MTGTSGTIRILSVTTGMFTDLLRINSGNNGPVQSRPAVVHNVGGQTMGGLESVKYVLGKNWVQVNMLFCIESIKTWLVQSSGRSMVWYQCTAEHRSDILSNVQSYCDIIEPLSLVCVYWPTIDIIYY